MCSREVFLVPKEMLLVAKVYSPVSSCLLHVIDNNTGEELPRVFQRVEPHVYKHNQVSTLNKLLYIQPLTNTNTNCMLYCT